MSVTQAPESLTEAEALEQVRAENRGVARRASRARVSHFVGMPIFLVLVLITLYVWLDRQELDSVVTRALSPDRLLIDTQRHLLLSVLSTVAVLILAIPLGIYATRPKRRRYAPIIIGLGNAGQAIPAYGLLALLFYLFRTVPWLPTTGIFPTVVALTAYSFLPILRNTMAGLDQVDPSVLEAGKGMGMPNSLVLRRLEFPLAIPVILAGVRTALVLNVGTATLAFVLGGGGLGSTIESGLKLQRYTIVITAATLVAVLALLIDHIAGVVEELVTPRGL
jgi:osmoprotectant transport system permease protein